LPGGMVPITHDLGVGHDRQPLRSIGMAHGAQVQTRAVEAEVTGETAGWGHAGSPVHCWGDDSLTSSGVAGAGLWSVFEEAWLGIFSGAQIERRPRGASRAKLAPTFVSGQSFL